METDVVAEMERLEFEYADLYGVLIESGNSRQEALSGLKELEDQKEDYENAVKRIKVLKEFNLSDLGSLNFLNVSEKERKEILWKLGINTKRGRYFIFKKPKRVGVRAEIVDVVFGQERLDEAWMSWRDDWTGRPYASEDAIDFLRGMKGWRD